MTYTFELLDGIILLSATIFSRMGDGKDSGKLLFKKLFSGQNFSVVEGENSLTFSTSGSTNFSINEYELAFGTGTGITSSPNFFVCTTNNEQALLGFGSIRSNCFANRASYVRTTNVKNGTFVIGGMSNSITGNSPYSIIIGGCRNQMSLGGNQTNASKNNVILSGTKNCIDYQSYNTIISGYRNSVQGKYSSIIGGFGNTISNSSFAASGYCNYYSAIIASECSQINTGRNFYNSYNLISSSCKSNICNSNEGSYRPRVEFNQIFGSNYSEIKNSSFYYETQDLEIIRNEFLTPNLLFNNILSSNKSSIGNYRTRDGYSTFNNLIGSDNACIEANFANLILSDGSKIFELVRPSDSPSSHKFTNIIGGGATSGTGSVMVGHYSNIIGSECSKDYSADNRNPTFTNVIGGKLHYISKGSLFSNIIGGTCHFLKGVYSTIIGGASNSLGVCGSQQLLSGSMLAGQMNCAISETDSVAAGGVFIGGCQNKSRTCDLVTMIGGGQNLAYVNSVILNGLQNCTGLNRFPKYGVSYDSSFLKPPYLIDVGSYRGVAKTYSQEIIAGGFRNCTGLAYKSSIISGRLNKIINTPNSVIIGGCCNYIESHGMFGTISENWFILGQSYCPGVPVPLSNRPPNYGTYQLGKMSNCFASGNFIVGGGKNSFGSCTAQNYSPTYGSVGLPTSKTHYVYNSGIVGGLGNKIYNKSRILTENYIIDGRFNENNRICNSVIVGGCGIILHRSNTFGTDHLIITGTGTQNRLFVGGTFGFSGTVNSPTQICVCNGFVIDVS